MPSVDMMDMVVVGLVEPAAAVDMDIMAAADITKWADPVDLVDLAADQELVSTRVKDLDRLHSTHLKGLWVQKAQTDNNP